MRVIVTAGGTGGHIYPALAIINKIKKEEPNSQILYVGTHNRMEKDLVPSLGIPYESIEITGLVRKFTFETPFKQLENCEFNGSGDYRYFGIDDKHVDGKDQVDVLYYSNTGYAVKLQTKENEEIILVNTSDKINNFNDLYKQVTENSSKYDGSKKIEKDDSLYVPYLKFNLYKEFDKLAGLKFKQSDGQERTIGKAVQTIQFQLSESGGDIKSEAAISTELTSAYDPDKNPRVFTYSNPFVIYLKEKDKDLPYFAAYITDLSKFQK